MFLVLNMSCSASYIMYMFSLLRVCRFVHFYLTLWFLLLPLPSHVNEIKCSTSNITGQHVQYSLLLCPNSIPTIPWRCGPLAVCKHQLHASGGAYSFFYSLSPLRVKWLTYAVKWNKDSYLWNPQIQISSNLGRFRENIFDAHRNVYIKKYHYEQSA